MQFCCRLPAWSIPLLGCRVCRAGITGQQAGSEHPCWEAAGRGGRQLPPHAFSRRDFTAAGRERGQGTGSARPDGTRLACRGVSHLGRGWGQGVPGVPVSRGDRGPCEPTLLGCCQGREGGRGAGMGGGGFWAHGPLFPPRCPGEGAEGSSEARCVCRASLGKQMRPGQGHLCQADACGCSPTSCCGFLELGMAAWGQRRYFGEAASCFRDGFGDMSQEEGFHRDWQVPGDGGRPQSAREPDRTLPWPLALRGHWGCWVPEANFKPHPKHRPACSASGREAGRGQTVKHWWCCQPGS